MSQNHKGNKNRIGKVIYAAYNTIVRLGVTFIVSIRTFYMKAKGIFNILSSSFRNPFLWQSLKWKKIHELLVIICLVIFIFIGIILDERFPFPLFGVYVGIFSGILIIAFYAERSFARTFDEVRGITRPYPEFDKANNLVSKAETSGAFIFVPVLVVTIFGAMGSILFGSRQITPTFIWSIIFFSVVVLFEHYWVFTVYPIM